MTTDTIPSLDYKVIPLGKLKVRQVHKSGDRLDCEVRSGNDSWVHTSQRFWTSFFARFGVSDSVFKYFGHQEVFDRIVEKSPDVSLRMTIEDGMKPRALAVSNPDKPIIHPDQFRELSASYGGSDVAYMDGVLSSTHTPTSGEVSLRIGGDDFQNRFVLGAPVDGYGKPSIHLSLLREICSNGAIGYAPAFRTDLTVGDDPSYDIARALDSFDSDEGYGALRQRFDAAQISPASLHETLKLYRKIATLKDAKTILAEYEHVVGDVHHMYGVANLEALSDRKLRLMPAKCHVYDLLNFASEVATHRVNGQEALKLQAWLGQTVSDEYDLEGTDKRRPDFRPTFTSPRLPVDVS